MNEIEKYEQQDEQVREERGLSPLRRPQARAVDLDDLERLGGELFVPDIWMIPHEEEGERDKDDAFESELIEVTPLAQFNPV